MCQFKFKTKLTTNFRFKSSCHSQILSWSALDFEGKSATQFGFVETVAKISSLAGSDELSQPIIVTNKTMSNWLNHDVKSIKSALVMKGHRIFYKFQIHDVQIWRNRKIVISITKDNIKIDHQIQEMHFPGTPIFSIMIWTALILRVSNGLKWKL